MIPLIDKNYTKILLFLAISPGSKYTRKELKEKTEMNNVPLDNSLNFLANTQTINEKNKLYSLNLENEFIKKFIEERNKLSNLPLKVQFELIDFLVDSLKLKSIKKIILFGSYSKLIFSEKSDIDLALILPNIKSKKGLEKKLIMISEKISEKYKKEIQLHFFNESDMRHKEDKLIKDILRNGVYLI